MRALLWDNRLLVGLGVNAGLLVAILVVLTPRSLSLPAGPSAFAQTAATVSSPQTFRTTSAVPSPGSTLPPTLGANASSTAPLIVMPGQLAPNIYGCYVLDAKNDSLCVYEYFHSDGLKLVAARNIAYDRRLQNFNTAPAPSEVKGLSEGSPSALSSPPPADPGH